MVEVGIRDWELRMFMKYCLSVTGWAFRVRVKVKVALRIGVIRG